MKIPLVTANVPHTGVSCTLFSEPLLHLQFLEPNWLNATFMPKRHLLRLRKNLETHSGIMGTVSYHLTGWSEGQVSSQPHYRRAELMEEQSSLIAFIYSAAKLLGS